MKKVSWPFLAVGVLWLGILLFDLSAPDFLYYIGGLCLGAGLADLSNIHKERSR